MGRSWILAQREPRISRAKIAQTIIVAAFLIPTFWQLNKYTNCDEIKNADPETNPNLEKDFKHCKD